MDQMLFRGTHSVKVDDKGRLKLPASVKDRLVEQYGATAGYFVTSLTGDKVLIYPLTEWERVEQSLAQVPQFDKLKNKFLNAANFYGAEATVDDQGRMLIPAKLRESAGMKGDVTLLWISNRIEVQNAGRHEASVTGNPFTDDDYEGLSKWNI